MPSATPPNLEQPEGIAIRRASDDFVNLTAHELKNPLKALAVDAEFLARHLQAGPHSERRTAELVDVAERLAVAAQQMSAQVNDLLALATDNQSDSDNDLVDLAALVDDVVGMFEDKLAAVNGTAEIGPLPTVVGAAPGLRMLFRNLISNAIRYRHPDRPLHLSIQAASRLLDDGHHRLTVSLTDNGVGVPPSEQRRIFDPYSRASTDDDGLGLGLTICERVVRRMGGTIHIDSNGETGSRFSIVLDDNVPTPLRMHDVPAHQHQRRSDNDQL